jgi:hypothetical protein
VAQGVPGRLWPQMFLTFGTTRVVGRQPYTPATFTPGEIPGTHFQRLSRPQGTWFRREPRKKSPVTPPGIDPGTSRLVVQYFNHYNTPDPIYEWVHMHFVRKSLCWLYRSQTEYLTQLNKSVGNHALPHLTAARSVRVSTANKQHSGQSLSVHRHVI